MGKAAIDDSDEEANDVGVVETVICTSKNITKRKVAEIALKKERDKLSKALKEIKTLSGLLPISLRVKKFVTTRGTGIRWKAIFNNIQTLSLAMVSAPIVQKKYIQISNYDENVRSGIPDACV